MSYIVPLFVRSYCNRLINQFSFVGTITKVDERMFLPSNEMSILKRTFCFPYILEGDEIDLLKSHIEQSELRKLTRLTIEVLERSTEETRVTNVQLHLISALENYSCETAKEKKRSQNAMPG